MAVGQPSNVETEVNSPLNFPRRNFLLFMPSEHPSLKAVLSYYSSTVLMTPEGDVAVTEEKISNGLGTLAHLLFGSLIRIVEPPKPARRLPHPSAQLESETSAAPMLPPPQANAQQGLPPEVEAVEMATNVRADATFWRKHVEPVLIACVPNPGYFVAGGLAGIISRTTTAPLDRLKVYLIAQTRNTDTVQAAKSGAALTALRKGAQSLVVATKELWAAGGIRSLYAGELWILFKYEKNRSHIHRKRLECCQSHAGISCQIWCIRGEPTRPKHTGPQLKSQGLKTAVC